MGAFESFVNANLGIRKPLIIDSGVPTESSKAAGVIGSHYIDTNTNFLYEKTGENNQQDWVFLRKLGEVISQDSQDPTRPFSASFLSPTGVSNVKLNYKDLGNDLEYEYPPQVIISMRTEGESEYFYAYSSHNVTDKDFQISFSDDIVETGNYMEILINKRPV